MQRLPRRNFTGTQLAAGLAAATAFSCASLSGAPPAALRPPPGPPGDVTGVVFDDRNGDGIQNAGEAGIPGVAVSNGVDVVVTDTRGGYVLTVEGDAIVFVVKPRDWMTGVDDRGLPRFYYVHKPHGSPDDRFRHAGVEPTGPLPDRIDFPLTRRPESDAFRVAVLSDPQPYTMAQLASFARDTIPELIGVDAAFGFSLGDLVGDDLNLFEPLNEVQGLVGIPWYNVIGNHDHNFLAPDDESADETYERVYGPATYAFQHARVHFIVIDNVLWLGFDGFDAPGKANNDNYEGGLRPDQMAFLRNYLATVPRDELVVLAMHIPFRKESVPTVAQQREILELLSSHPHTMSISGHSHRQQHSFFRTADGYAPAGGGEHQHLNAGAASGSWYRGATDEVGLPSAMMRDGTPKGYTIMQFDGVDFSARYKVNRRPADYQMNVFVPFHVHGADAAETEVVVNVFAGSPRSKVEMRVAGGVWRPMERVRRLDPFYTAARGVGAGWPDAPWRELPVPARSTHVWTARLPADLPTGTHLVEVRTRDVFGQAFDARAPIRVE